MAILHSIIRPYRDDGFAGVAQANRERLLDAYPHVCIDFDSLMKRFNQSNRFAADRHGRLRVRLLNRGYDSDPLRERLRRRGIELIVLYRENNQHRRYEDGPKLRRYKRRWIVERTNDWLGQFRRLLVRHGYLLSTYRAFFYLACVLIRLMRCF
jgi:transposase